MTLHRASLVDDDTDDVALLVAQMNENDIDDVFSVDPAELSSWPLANQGARPPNGP
jgi:hypothetical protein